MNPLRIAVLGSGFGAAEAACRLAKGGHRVWLVHPLASVGGDVTASHHAWIENGTTGEPLPLPVGREQKALYVRLVEAGVTPLLLTHCAGVSLLNGLANGLLLAHPFGLGYLAVDAVLDATATQAAGRHLGVMERPGRVLAEYTFDAEGMPRLAMPTIPVPAELGVKDNAVYLHATLRPQGAGVTFRFEFDMPKGVGGRTALELAAHGKAVAVHAWLKENAPYCETMEMSQLPAHTRLLDMPAAAGLPGNIWPLAESMPMDFSTADVAALEERAAGLAEAVAAQAKPNACKEGVIHSHGKQLKDVTLLEETPEGWPKALLAASFDASSQGFETLRKQAVVAGGGTGGAMAAWALAEEGIDAAVIEQSYYFGGTNTIGLVAGNWHGYTGGLWARRLQEAQALPLKGRIANTLLWDRILGVSNMTVLLGMTVCGVIARDGRVQGALAYGEDGFAVVCGEQVIDGTAESSLCVFAGAQVDIGGERDGYVQSSSMWGIDPRPFTYFHDNHYAMDIDVVRPGHFADLLRAIGQAHRFNSDYLISDLYTVREGRRIEGEYGMSMRDIALRKCHEDTIAVALCTHDTHGRASSMLNTLRMFSKDMSETGEVDIRIRLPLRAFLPKGLEGIAVVGKCISGEREAVSLSRMNPDICNAGYAVGLCAAHAIRQQKSLRETDLTAARARLRELTVLPEWADVPENTVTAEMAKEALGEDKNGGFLSMMLTEGETEAYLPDALRGDGIRARNAAMALAWFGRKEAAPVLAELLREQAALDVRAFAPEGYYDKQAVRMDGFSRNVTSGNAYGHISLPPDDPDFSYGRINQWMVLLAMTGEREAALEAILPYAERAESGGPYCTGKTPYSHARRDTHALPMEDRLWSLAMAIERVADARAIPALTRLLHDENIRQPVCTDEFEPLPPLLCTYLEIGLARALARCGGLEGALRLADYTADVREVYARMARRELTELYGLDYGCDAAAWRDALSAMDTLPVKPYAGSPYA